MKTLDDKDIFNKVLATDENTLLTQIQIEITSMHNKNKAQDALRAIEIYTKVLAIKQNVHLYFYRAYNYRMLNEHRNAIGDYTEIMKLDDGFCSIYSMRAEEYFKICEYELSLADYSIAIPRNGNYDLYLSRAECYFMLNKFDLAQNDWDQAIKIKPGADRDMEEAKTKMYREADRLEQEELAKKKSN